MRCLTLIRHAKSSHAQAGLRDYYRPLNDRGFADAPKMGGYLRTALEWKPDRIISSSAIRTMSTARLIAESAGFDEAIIHQEETLYEAPTRAILDVIQDVPDSVQHLCIVGHNPGMENTSNLLIGQREVVDFVTCAVAMLELKVDSWRSVKPGCATLLRFLTPRSLWGSTD